MKKSESISSCHLLLAENKLARYSGGNHYDYKFEANAS